jgi:hypothetical protein
MQTETKKQVEQVFKHLSIVCEVLEAETKSGASTSVRHSDRMLQYHFHYPGCLSCLLEDMESRGCLADRAAAAEASRRKHKQHNTM